MRFVAVAVVLAVGAAAPRAAGTSSVQENRPTFKAGVDRVTVTAVVQKRNGQPVTDLARDDFEVLDNGRPRPILEFRSEPTPATVALLVDFSGSMNFASKIPAARQASAEVLAGLIAGVDRVGLYAFDTRLHELQKLQPADGDLLRRFDAFRPFGSTSLYDAIAETGRLLAADGSTRRAVVALTDGSDNASRLSVAQVTRMASEVDVPVYIVVIVSPLDHEAASKDDIRAAAEGLAQSHLGNLAHRTGGEIFLVSTDLHLGRAAHQIITELRHQYFIGFAPDNSRPGWHPIDVRTREKDLIVRARSGYVAQSRPVSDR